MSARRWLPALWLGALLACAGGDEGRRLANGGAGPAEDTVVESAAPPVTVPETPPSAAVEEAPPRSYPFHLPYRVEDACAGCIAPILVCAPVVARRADRESADVVATFQPGDTLTLLDATGYVDAPDIIVFHDTLSITEVERWPPGRRPIVFQPGDTVYVLTYGSEGGEGTWWHRGRLLESENVWMFRENLPWISRTRDGIAESLGTYASRRWLELEAPDGRRGWVLQEPGTLTYGTIYDSGFPPCE